jgi:trehalose 6-phosphate synthase/phosphatase
MVGVVLKFFHLKKTKVLKSVVFYHILVRGQDNIVIGLGFFPLKPYIIGIFTMKRLLIIANRLPCTVKQKGDQLEYIPSTGGLATGLNSLEGSYKKIWVGWPGIYPRDKDIKKKITEDLKQQDIYPVYLSERDVKLYYEGFSNKTIWPLFHYFMQYTDCRHEFYSAYENVNKIFAQKVLEVAEPGDKIWIQDYHLMLLPGLLRKQLHHNEIGFFLHIPFPSYELFRMLPWRNEILDGLLGSDLIGFHTHEYMRHFMSAVYRIKGIEQTLGRFYYGNRVVQVDSFPMGIDYNKYHDAGKDKKVQSHIQAYRKKYGDVKLILSVDRLDYSKGIVNRLLAFAQLLKANPQYKEKISLILLVVPSRSQVEHYRELKIEIDETVGNINGQYSTMEWTPIHYLYRAVPFAQLSAMYKIADICLVTPFRDGMNLVAKEFIASRTDNKGVLILSEMAGSVIELSEALIINPYDIDGIARSMKAAIKMSKDEQKARLDHMQQTLARQTVHKWASDFMKILESVTLKQRQIEKKTIGEHELTKIEKRYSLTDERLFLLDYDGTLMPYFNKPEDAKPDDELIAGLNELCRDERNKVVILSGRDHRTLEAWFTGINVELVAEHGTWYKEEGNWIHRQTLSDTWKEDIYPILQEFVDKTPGSFIEEKPYSLVWHYRKTDIWLAEIRVEEVLNSLVYPSTRNGLEIMEGNKVIEIKTAGINKGKAAEYWLDKGDWDFVLTIGDDRTDEDMFAVMPEGAFSIRVGMKLTHANYNIRNWQDVRSLLSRLAAITPVIQNPDVYK